MSSGAFSQPDEELSQLLDAAITPLTTAQRTFTEEEALSTIWEAGYEVSPQDDPRFQIAWEATPTTPRHWRLAHQSLANDRLLDALSTGAWDGRELDDELARLSDADQTSYVFCPVDPRFVIADDGTLDLADRELNLALSPHIKGELDRLGIELLARWRAVGVEPWTVRQILMGLADLGWPDAWKREGWLFVRAWLLQWPEVARVGRDYWVPRSDIPSAPTPTRLAVLPVVGAAAPPSIETAREPFEAAIQTEDVSITPTRAVAHGRTRVVQRAQWRVRLRTIHINQGFIPIPSGARTVYPPRGLHEGEQTAMRGLWFDTNERLWLWLDREHHRFYGPGLADQIGWCSTGDILEVEWDVEGIVLRIAGHDEAVEREEGRLVDLQALAALRGGLGESYRRSIQIILSTVPDGLTFPEIVRALRERQQHEVARTTVRSVLHAGGFIHRDGRWFAAPDSEAGARLLRRALVASIDPEEPSQSSSATGEHSNMRRSTQRISDRLSEIIRNLRDYERE